MPSTSAAEACPACGRHEWEALFESRSFTIGRCTYCRLVRTLGVVDDDGASYPAFDQRETAVVKAMRFAVTQLLRERARLVEKVAPPPVNGEPLRVLDVGCGSGSFARMMSERGWNASGVEPFSLGREVDDPNLHLVRAPLEKAWERLGTFDVITMWHVLEHVNTPEVTLGILKKILRPNGVIVVSVPNFDSWQSKVFKGGWFHLDPPRHVTHYDHATLMKLFDALDLEVFAERTFHIEYGPVGWLQSALNTMLPRKNFLYEFVKDRGALANVPAWQTAMNLALSGVTGAAVAPLSILVEIIAGMKGAGSVLTFVARPRAV